MLFFVISELAAIEPMYQYSLAWFVGLFEATLLQADKARELHKRIDNLLQHFQYSLYLKVGDTKRCSSRAVAVLMDCRHYDLVCTGAQACEWFVAVQRPYWLLVLVCLHAPDRVLTRDLHQPPQLSRTELIVECAM